MPTFPSELTDLFEVGDIINTGSYGIVFKVIKKSNRYLGNQKKYAMKVIIRTNPGYKDIEIEMQVLSFVNPYKLHLDSFFVNDDNYFMVLDYCRNGELGKAISNKIKANKYFEEDEIWKYFIQICFGLECLHYNDFIHRDLHEQNVLLDDQNNIKIADFGISRYLQSRNVQGASAYYSPRTCNEMPQSKESDIWAVGCLLYFLCNLEHPFGTDKIKIKDEPHRPINSRYSNELRNFVDWCLKKQREERPTVVDILTNGFIIKKTQNLEITIPQTSTMNTAIYINLLNQERENYEILKSKLLECNREINTQKERNESLEAELYRLNNIIKKGINLKKNSKQEFPKYLDYKQELQTEKAESINNNLITLQLKGSSSEITVSIESTNDENLNASKQVEESQNQNDILTVPNLRGKKTEAYNRSFDAYLEQGVMMACTTYKNNSCPRILSLKRAYQEKYMINHQKASLYNLISKDGRTTTLVIYDTETETKEEKLIQTLEPLGISSCIAQLPSGKLFCYGKYNLSGITLIIDESGEVQELPSGTPCCRSSAIYFSSNVFCFGGENGNPLTLSSRFDLGRNKWVELAPLPKADWACNSIIFNENILISGFWNTNLVRYSICSDSFTTIPYQFAEKKIKILINGERLYLIECENGSMYESEIRSDTSWRRIADSTISVNPWQTYYTYNKGGAYIGSFDGNWRMHYFKFNLLDKSLIGLP